MSLVKIKELVAKPIAGEWGNEDISGNGVFVIRTTNFTKTGEIDFSNIIKREIDIKKVEQKRLRKNDLIIEKSGGGPKTPVGRVILFDKNGDEPYLCNNFTAILRPRTDKVIPKYLLYQFMHLYNIGKVKKYQNQTIGLYNLKIDRYLNEEIDLPDVKTQSRYVAYLEKIQELINNRTQSIQLLDKYIQSVFLEMFLENFDKWKYLPLKETEGIKSRIQGIGKKSNSDSIGTPMLRMNNLTSIGGLLLDDLKWIKLSDKEKTTFKLEDRNVLFNRTNSPELVGKIAVWDKGEDYTFAGYLVKFELDEHILNPYYLASYYNSYFGKIVLKSKARISGNLANLSGSKFLDQKILLPPIDLQKKYEDTYTKVNSLRTKLLSQNEKLKTLFQSSLQNAFSEETEIDENDFFDSIIQNLSITELKEGKRLEHLLNWINKEDCKFKSIEQYDEAWNKLRELIKDGSIEQFLDNDTVKLKLAK